MSVYPNTFRTCRGRELFENSELVAGLFKHQFPGVDEDEAALWEAVLRGRPEGAGVLLDIGCGAGRLTGFLGKLVRSDETVIGVDVALGWLRCGQGLRVAGDAAALPIHQATANGAVSALLSLNETGAEGAFAAALEEIGRTLRPGGVSGAELLAAWEPERLTGLSESLEESDGSAFAFLLHDVVRREVSGAVLRAEMRLSDGRRSTAVPLHLFVPRLGGIGAMMERAGLELVGYSPPHDGAVLTQSPPSDAVRVIARARRR